MNPLSKELDSYLTIRRSLGYDLSTAERILRRFIFFAEQHNAEHITSALCLQWLEDSSASRQTQANQLGTIRRFSAWLHVLDPANEILPQSLVPCRRRRSMPYIYSEEEIRRIVETAAELPSLNGIRALTCSTLFGLIAVTGLRVSEAISLNVDDIDIKTGVLVLRRGKLGKERLLPLSESTTRYMAAYDRERDRLLGHRPEPFFISDRGERMTDCSARYNFAAVCQTIGLRPAQKYHRHGRGPRIHDLRHSFAVRTLINWYCTGKNPASEMIKLSTYLGHANPANTYWYIEAVPELLELASRRVTGTLDTEVAS